MASSDYDCEAAKIIAQSGCVEALKFDAASGKIKTSSAVGISAEMDYAFAVWNFYDKESAIDRVILSRLEVGGLLPKVLSDSAEKIQLKDTVNINEDFAEYFAKKSASCVKDKIQAGRAVDGEVPVNVSRIPQIFHTVGEVVSALWEQIVFVGRHAEDLADFFSERISGKQLIKNMAVTTVSVSGAGAGWALGSTVAAVAGLPAVTIFSLSVAAGYGAKLFYKKIAKAYLDRFICEDSEEMLKIFGDELSKMLSGKFLTLYEIAILMEAIRDDINKSALKDMYASGNDSAQAAWARRYIEKRLEEIFSQRIFVEMPSTEDWAEGIRRVDEKLKRGEDIFAEMETRRKEALTNMRAHLSEFKLKPYEIAPAVQAVNAMNKTQIAVERTLKGMQTSELRFQTANQRLDDEWAKLNDELERG